MAAHVNHGDPTTNQPGHRHDASTGVFKRDWFSPDSTFDVQAKYPRPQQGKKKRKNQFQYIKYSHFSNETG
jgi:hypothetical protein